MLFYDSYSHDCHTCCTFSCSRNERLSWCEAACSGWADVVKGKKRGVSWKRMDLNERLVTAPGPDGTSVRILARERSESPSPSILIWYHNIAHCCVQYSIFCLFPSLLPHVGFESCPQFQVSLRLSPRSLLMQVTPSLCSSAAEPPTVWAELKLNPVISDHYMPATASRHFCFCRTVKLRIPLNPLQTLVSSPGRLHPTPG